MPAASVTDQSTGGRTPRVSVVMANEFGSVRLSVDLRGNGPRLKVESLRSGAVGFLDPLDLESLVTAPPDVREAVVRPENRWA